MMKMLKRIACLLTAAVMTTAAMPLNAAAERNLKNDATAVRSGKSQSIVFERDSDNGAFSWDERFYKIEADASGKLEIEYDGALEGFEAYLLDGEENRVTLADIGGKAKHEKGDSSLNESGNYFSAGWDGKTMKGSLEVKLPKKGTYYFRIYIPYGQFDGKLTLKFTYPDGSKTVEKVDYITIPMKNGETLQLGVEGSGDVTWSSSKKKIATVSDDGLVTAKKAGSTVITAKSGKSSKKVKIVVS